MLQVFLRGVFTRRAQNVTYSIASNNDIAPEIAEGVADFALLGSDKFGELPLGNGLGFEPIGVLACRFALLAPADLKSYGDTEMTVATSYPNALITFLAKTGVRARCARIMSGKVERAPASGLTNAAFDIVETGNSLRANGLQIIQEGQRIELGGIWKEQT